MSQPEQTPIPLGDGQPPQEGVRTTQGEPHHQRQALPLVSAKPRAITPGEQHPGQLALPTTSAAPMLSLPEGVADDPAEVQLQTMLHQLTGILDSSPRLAITHGAASSSGLPPETTAMLAVGQPPSSTVSLLADMGGTKRGRETAVLVQPASAGVLPALPQQPEVQTPQPKQHRVATDGMSPDVAIEDGLADLTDVLSRIIFSPEARSGDDFWSLRRELSDQFQQEQQGYRQSLNQEYALFRQNEEHGFRAEYAHEVNYMRMLQHDERLRHEHEYAGYDRDLRRFQQELETMQTVTMARNRHVEEQNQQLHVQCHQAQEAHAREFALYQRVQQEVPQEMAHYTQQIQQHLEQSYTEEQMR